MSEQNCDHNCANCGSYCGERDTAYLKETQNKYSNVKKVIGIVSGKGGVGKSMVTALCSVGAMRMGYNAAILDADITGPSIPKMFRVKDKATADETGLLPALSENGIKLMSVNLVLENESDPVAVPYSPASSSNSGRMFHGATSTSCSWICRPAPRTST